MFDELAVFESLLDPSIVDDVRSAVTVTAPSATYADIEAARLAEYKNRGYSVQVVKA